MSDIRIGSLFSGYGGLDAAALATLGGHARVVWHSDIKPASVALLAARDPGVPNLGNIKFLHNDRIPAVDALTFGWPCQPHSSAGKRLGEADPRALWPEVARVIAALRPRHLFGENVARVASNGELRRVVRTLAELRYVGTYRTLRASDVGAPHRRDRLFLYATTADANSATRRLPWPADTRARTTAHGRGSAQPGRGNSRGASSALTLLPTPSASSYGSNQGGAAGRVGPVRHSLESLARHSVDWGKYTPAIERWQHIIGREAPPSSVASELNPRFAEWMMGLPAGWVDLPELSRRQQLNLIGDGVVPQQAIAAFTELTARLHGQAIAA